MDASARARAAHLRTHRPIREVHLHQHLLREAHVQRAGHLEHGRQILAVRRRRGDAIPDARDELVRLLRVQVAADRRRAGVDLLRHLRGRNEKERYSGAHARDVLEVIIRELPRVVHLARHRGAAARERLTATTSPAAARGRFRGAHGHDPRETDERLRHYVHAGRQPRREFRAFTIARGRVYREQRVFSAAELFRRARQLTSVEHDADRGSLEPLLDDDHAALIAPRGEGNRVRFQHAASVVGEADDPLGPRPRAGVAADARRGQTRKPQNRGADERRRRQGQDADRRDVRRGSGRAAAIRAQLSQQGGFSREREGIRARDDGAERRVDERHLEQPLARFDGKVDAEKRG